MYLIARKAQLKDKAVQGLCSRVPCSISGDLREGSALELAHISLQRVLSCILGTSSVATRRNVFMSA